jgi:predicted dehydrogenase
MYLKNKESLRLAFIGGGCNSAIGYTHYNACRMDGYFSVDAGCFSRDELHNMKTALAYGVDKDRAYTDWRTMLEAEKNFIDAIVVLTPIPVHAEIVSEALGYGFPVICEKSLGVSSAECHALYKIMQKNKGYLAVTFNYSGYPMVRQLRQMISDDRLGKLQQILIEMPQESFLRDGANLQSWRELDYGVPTVSLDLGVHVYHLVSFLTSGMKPLKVVGDQSSLGRFQGLVDTVFSIAHFEKDLKVQAWWSKAALGHRNGLRIRIYGSKASAEWYQMSPELLRWSDNDGHQLTIDRSSGEAKLAREARYNRFKAGHPSGFIEAFSNLYTDIAGEINSFISGAEYNSIYTFGAEHSALGLEYIEAINKSSNKNAWEEV